MKHKILGIDLDGTLLTRTKKITKKVCLALNEFMKAGGLPVLVTGRSTVSTLKYCEKIERHSKNKMKFVCCFNGAYIHDRVNNITYSNMIPDAKVRKIFSFIIDNNLSAWFYTESSRKKGGVHSYGYYPSLFTSLFKNLKLFKWTCIPNADIDISCYKININCGSSNNADKVYNQLFEMFKGQITLSKSLSSLIEVTDINIDKGFAIKTVATKLGYSTDDIAFIGDSCNDIPAFAAADRSFAVKPANPQVNQYASDLFKSKRNAVSKIITHYLLNEELTTRVRMVASDLDGTLLENKTKDVVKPTKKIIKQMVDEEQMYFCIATGRNIDDVKVLLKNLELKDYSKVYAVVVNGSLIYSCKENKYIYQKCLLPEIAQQIFDEVVSMNKSGKYGKVGCFIHRVIDLKSIDFKHNSKLLGYNLEHTRSKLNVLSKNFTKKNWYPKDFVEVSDKFDSANVCKFVIYSESPEKNERLHQHFINLQLKATICKSSKINVEINANDVSKGNAIAFLSEKLGININQVATVGDEENDISMLSLTSNSFTLSSSNEKVRSSAAYVLNSKPSYLVKEVIEKVVFNK